MTKTKYKVRVISLLLSLLQVVGLLTVCVYAAPGEQTSGNAKNWSQKVPLNYPVSQNGDYSAVERDYSLFDAASGYRVSDYKRAIVWSQHMLGGNFHSLSIPAGRDWKAESSYTLSLYGGNSKSEKTGYQFGSLAPNKASRNYYHFQSTELQYTTGSDWKRLNIVPNDVLLHHSVYYIAPAKAARYGNDSAEEKQSEGYLSKVYPKDEQEAIKALFPTYQSKIQQHEALSQYIQSQNKLMVGGYHPQLAFSLVKDNAKAGTSGSNTAEMFLTCVEGSNLDVAQATEYVNVVMDEILEYVENTRIDSPDITAFEIAGSKARIDTQTHTIRLRKPAGQSWTSETPVIETNGDTYAELKNGSLASGSDRLMYRVTPYCPVTGILYNGQKDTKGGVYTDLGQDWTVIIDTGDPYNDVTSFSVYDATAKKYRYGTIVNGADATEPNTITLNLPQNTDLTKLKPVITHMGKSVSIQNGSSWEVISPDKTYDFSTPRKIRVTNEQYQLETEYTVTVTANPSSECEIVSFSIGHATGVVDQEKHTISIEVPYGTVLSAQSPEIGISEFASLTVKPSSLVFGQPLTYQVTAEDGKTKQAYQLTITETPAATGKSILSFDYGSISGTISGTKITLTVPFGTDVTALKPSITVSPFAVVSPQSDTAQDFTNPVQYTVTAQNKTQQVYTVTVKQASKPTDPPEKDRLYKIRDNILASYKTTQAGADHDGRVVFDDWVLMNLGFAERTGKPVTPGDKLPYNLDIYDQVAELAPNKMTDYGRIIMMLTALGIDASKLDAYGDGEPFKDASGKVVHNLVEELYKYNKGYTINGPIFALIALDMGNYTVPKDAKWTRQNLLKEILAHEYGSDGWGIDMVAMLMQSLYPYINDPTYGAQVKAKLQEGYDIILGYKAAPSVDPMGSDYSFYSWGTTNSEATAQVICAMCVMGVDVGYDPNFSDYANKQGVLYLWLNRFLCSNDSGFGHTDTGYNEMATYQSMYALQWYLGFFENGGAGFPYSLYYHQQDFSRALSKECAITKFTLEGQEGVISNREITIKVPDGMPLEKLTPEVTVSEGARLLAPAFPVTFVAGTPTAFTVQAEDGTTQQTFYVTPKYDASVKGKGTTLFTDTIQIQNEDLADKDMEDMQVTKNDDGTTDILITIVPGVDTTKLRFKADISYKATASIDVTGKSNVDLHDWTDVVITAEDGATTAKYRVKVVSQTFASITEFVIKVDGVEYGAEIKATGATGTIRFTGIPDTADLTRVTPTKITLGEGTTEVLPSASAPQNFAEGAEYTVKGEGLRTRTYSVVTSSKGGGGDDGDDTPTVNRSFAITSFKIGDTAAEIDDKNGIIKITLPYGTNLYQQAPKIETGSGCTVSPRSGQVVNLSLPVTYTLTRGDETRTYTVIVTLKKSASQLIWDKAAVKLNPSSYQTSPDLGKKEPERTYIPSTSQILSGMKVQVNGKDVTYQASGVSNWLTMTPDSYSAASTYRFRAEKGALKNIAANGYNGFGIQAGKLHIGITEKMDTARGLDLSLCPVPAAAQTAWKNKSGVVGVWKITCDSVSGGLTLTFDCAGQTGKLALAKYNEAKKCFEQVSEKKWSVSGTTLTASNLSAGIYGILKIG